MIILVQTPSREANLHVLRCLLFKKALEARNWHSVLSSASANPYMDLRGSINKENQGLLSRECFTKRQQDRNQIRSVLGSRLHRLDLHTESFAI
jgi:hypothetical protein